MDSRLYRRTTAEWYPFYKLQGKAWCIVTIHMDWQAFSYSALSAMVSVICEGDKNVVLD
jgi:hypothetical protein